MFSRRSPGPRLRAPWIGALREYGPQHRNVLRTSPEMHRVRNARRNVLRTSPEMHRVRNAKRGVLEHAPDRETRPQRGPDPDASPSDATAFSSAICFRNAATNAGSTSLLRCPGARPPPRGLRSSTRTRSRGRRPTPRSSVFAHPSKSTARASISSSDDNRSCTSSTSISVAFGRAATHARDPSIGTRSSRVPWITSVGHRASGKAGC